MRCVLHRRFHTVHEDTCSLDESTRRRFSARKNHERAEKRSSVTRATWRVAFRLWARACSLHVGLLLDGQRPARFRSRLLSPTVASGYGEEARNIVDVARPLLAGHFRADEESRWRETPSCQARLVARLTRALDATDFRWRQAHVDGSS